MINIPNFPRINNESDFGYMIRLSIAKLNKEFTELDWLDIKDIFNFQHSAESLRKYAAGWKLLYDNFGEKVFEILTNDKEEIKKSNIEPKFNYKETTEVLSDGSYKSDKLLRMSLEQSKDVNFILEAHGFDYKSWELVNAKNSIWNVNSNLKGVEALYSSRITVKPKKNGFDFDELIRRIEDRVKPIHIDVPETDEKYSGLLEIPLFDMHFGVSDLIYYEPHLKEILQKVNYNKWDTILFVIGQDLLHNDNFKGQTANGTQIDKVDMVKAFDEALKFYEILISHAIKQSKNVKCIYVKGNHDESMSYGLFRVLQATFPQVDFDNSLKQRKAFTWKNIFIGFSHGDKGINRILDNFVTEYGKLIANAKVKEVHLGHIHQEKVKDRFGLVQRNLSTANKTDNWHDDMGFVGANKRFQLFEYSPNRLKSIHYVGGD